MARRVDAREVALAHGGHARLQLRDDGAAQHGQPVTRPEGRALAVGQPAVQGVPPTRLKQPP